MPARVVVVLDEPGFADQVVAVLNARGADAVAIHDPITALSVFEGAARIELLITCMEFGKGKLNGLALARMVRMRRPDTKVLFLGGPELARYTAGLGEFIETPVTAEAIIQIATHWLEIGSL
jgi:DNA-binding NtrC family response regulator